MSTKSNDKGNVNNANDTNGENGSNLGKCKHSRRCPQPYTHTLEHIYIHVYVVIDADANNKDF